MLYRLQLPLKTQACLTDLLRVQMDLLEYALDNSTLLQAPAPVSTSAKVGKKAPTKHKEHKERLIEECATYLNRHSKRNKGYGQQIAREFFNAPLDAREGRITLLQTLAQKSAHVPHDKKRKWLDRLTIEIEAIFPKSGVLTVEIHPFNPEKAAWKDAAGAFLRYFYDAYLGDYTKKIPEEFLTDSGEKGFTRPELVELFHTENPDLEICAMCDETKFYTRYQLQESEGKKGQSNVRSHVVLDHYLPKNSYPHLCCHPCNLIPICYACNSPTKNSYDPLKGRGSKLETAALPYHEINLSKQAYMQVDVQQKAGTTLATIQGLASRDPAEEKAITEATMLLKDVYKLPNRWSEERQMNSIMHTLFRRMRHFFDDSKSSPLVADSDDEIFSKLKQLLYYLDHDDQQRDPYAFAMTWILAAFLNERKQTDPSVWRGLLQEIETVFKQSIDASEQRERYVEDLLKIL